MKSFTEFLVIASSMMEMLFQLIVARYFKAGMGMQPFQ
jgi:hypothetical protein